MDTENGQQGHAPWPKGQKSVLLTPIGFLRAPIPAVPVPVPLSLSGFSCLV
jgi:hypothetical protein